MISLSLLEDTTVFLKGEIFNVMIYAVWPLKVLKSYPFLVDQIRMVVSLDPVAI